MARIKIEDLPVLEDLSAKESKGIFGGFHPFNPLNPTFHARKTTHSDKSDDGMTQIDPPTLKLDVDPADETLDAVVDDLKGVVKLV